jgi:hypothetical protein
MPFRHRSLSLASQNATRVLSLISNATLVSSKIRLKRFTHSFMCSLTSISVNMVTQSLPVRVPKGKRFRAPKSKLVLANLILEEIGRMRSLRSISLVGTVPDTTFLAFLNEAFGSTERQGNLIHLERFSAWDLSVPQVAEARIAGITDILGGMAITCPRLRELLMPYICPISQADLVAVSKLTKIERLYLNITGADLDYSPLSSLASLRELQAYASPPPAELFRNPSKPLLVPSSFESTHSLSWKSLLERIEMYRAAGVSRLRRDTLLQVIGNLFVKSPEAPRSLEILKHPIVLESVNSTLCEDGADEREQYFLESANAAMAPPEVERQAAMLFLAPSIAQGALTTYYYMILDGFLTSAVALLFRGSTIPMLDAIVSVAPKGLIPNRMLLAHYTRAQWYDRALDLFRQICKDEIELLYLAYPDMTTCNDLHNILTSLIHHHMSGPEIGVGKV